MYSYSRASACVSAEGGRFEELLVVFLLRIHRGSIESTPGVIHTLQRFQHVEKLWLFLPQLTQRLYTVELEYLRHSISYLLYSSNSIEPLCIQCIL